MKKINTVNRFDFHPSGFVWQAYLILLTKVHVSAFGKLIQLYDYINNETQNQNAYIFHWNYRKSSIKHPPGGLFISNTFGMRLIQFSKDDGISSPQRTRIQSKSSSTKNWRSCSPGSKTFQTSSWRIDYPGSVHKNLYRCDWWIQSSIC